MTAYGHRSISLRLAAAVLPAGAATGIAPLLQSVGVPHTSPPHLLAVLFAALYGGAGAGLSPPDARRS
ncbi:MAG TPA: hypothetical protein VEU30_07625 [Thermoanaerobaculia bacterium]|nr:hypothetical protein [Thermoanaerobaculia bacterium]